ncbi:MAG: hypothetical protein ACHREM_18115 [Polyangiales bacterium]
MRSWSVVGAGLLVACGGGAASGLNKDTSTAHESASTDPFVVGPSGKYPACALRSAASVAPPASSASLNGSNVPGVDATLARIRWRFKRCFTAAQQTRTREGLPRWRLGDGETKIVVTLGPDGAIATTAIRCSTSDDETAECVLAAFHDVQFSPPDGGHAEFTVPVVLKTR